MNMKIETFEEMLTGGHPNSLGRTVEVVDIVLSNSAKLEDLYHCYFSSDEVVRLRTSNAFKRISRVHPAWLVPYIDQFLYQISQIDQASTQWTLADLFQTLAGDMNPEQKRQAQAHLQKNLATHKDWIVLNTTMQTLAEWAEKDAELKTWLLPHLERLSVDKRKSVAKKAKKLSATLRGLG